MARIHELAVMSADTTNLIDLVAILTEATNLVMKDQPPHTHPVVRFICHMIAFAGDGDLESPTYYKDILDFCIDNIAVTNTEEKYPDEPNRITS